MKYLGLAVLFSALLFSCDNQPTKPKIEGSGFDEFSINFISNRSSFFLDIDHFWILTDIDLFYTNDGGNSWDSLGNIPTDKLTYEHYLFFSDTLNGWLTIENNRQILYKTTDGGNTWSEIRILPSFFYSHDCNQVFVNKNTGFITSHNTDHDKCIKKTTNNGNSWNDYIIKPQLTSGRINSGKIDFIDENNGFISGDEYSSSKYYGFLLKTTDCGKSWTRTKTGFENTISHMKFISKNTGWIVVNNELHKTTDAGETWNKQLPLNNVTIRRIFFTDENNGWIAHSRVPLKEYSYDNYQLQRTTDGGNTWHFVNHIFSQIENPNFEADISNMYFNNSNQGWILTLTGKLLKTQNGGNILN